MNLVVLEYTARSRLELTRRSWVELDACARNRVVSTCQKKFVFSILIFLQNRYIVQKIIEMVRNDCVLVFTKEGKEKST